MVFNSIGNKTLPTEGAIVRNRMKMNTQTLDSSTLQDIACCTTAVEKLNLPGVKSTLDKFRSKVQQRWKPHSTGNNEHSIIPAWQFKTIAEWSENIDRHALVVRRKNGGSAANNPENDFQFLSLRVDRRHGHGASKEGA